MKAITMTRELAFAASTDAANRLMRKKGLKAWDEECADMAVASFHRLYAHNFLKSINHGKCPECHEA